MRTKLLAALCFIVTLAVPSLMFGQAAAATSPKPIVANIDTTTVSRPISKYQYGMFIEELGSLVYRTLWSEMLDDRKFYYPIEPKKPNARPVPRGFFFRMMQRTWRPVGPGSSVVMDKEYPFVGEHSPRIELDASAPRGIRQSGFALMKGMRYTGHIYLRGTPGSKVKVSLLWGAATGDRENVAFKSISRAYHRFNFSFTADADSTDATLEITGTGSGNFHVGTVSLMPADNIDGFRPEVIALLRQLRSGFWRLPGGNFISDFNWYDSVGPRDKRPPTFDYAWNAVQSNDVGLDEFMTFCKLIGVEPYITVNAGFGDAHSAGQEVEYMNGSIHTRFGAMRARNGHPAPYRVKFWNMGNEPYGPWELGRTDLKYYVLKNNEFAAAMRKADPSITLLASGAMPDEMLLENVDDADQKPAILKFCSDDDWTCGYLKHSWGTFSGITEHWYARAGVRFDPERAAKGLRVGRLGPGYVPIKQTVLQWVRVPSDRIHLKAEEWEEYEKLFPEMVKDKIFMSNDEYAYTGGPADLKMALAYAMVFNEMLRHTDFLRMSAFTMGVSTLDINQTAAAFNTTGLLFKLYGDHMGAGLLPVAVPGNSPQPPPEQHLIGDLPRSSAGSPTYPLDVEAALSPDRKYLNIAVVNATDTEQKLDLNLTGARIDGPAIAWQLTGSSLQATDRLGQDPQVGIKEITGAGTGNTLSVTPISVEIFRIPVSQTAQ